jgi:hypothetical protein
MYTIKPILISSINDIDKLVSGHNPYYLLSPGSLVDDDDIIERFGVISRNIGMDNTYDQIAMAIRNKVHMSEYWFLYPDPKSLYDVGITYLNYKTSTCWISGSILLHNMLMSLKPNIVYIPEIREDIRFNIPPYPRSLLYRPITELGFKVMTYPLGMFNHQPVKANIIDFGWDKIPSILRDYGISTKYIIDRINNMAHRTVVVITKYKVGDLVPLKSPEINSKLLIERMIVDDMYNKRIQ